MKTLTFVLVVCALLSACGNQEEDAAKKITNQIRSENPFVKGGEKASSAKQLFNQIPDDNPFVKK